MRFVLVAFIISMLGCTTAHKPVPVPVTTVAKKKEGPATRKVRARQQKMQEELNFTLGDPVHSRVRNRMQDDRFTKSYGRPK